MDTKERATVLCVDDEVNELEGLAVSLRRRYHVITAPDGAAGLAALQHHAATAVVISDMRMPGMDGATFLHRTRQVAPDAVRLLLTGHADLESAAAAVNHGQIFRFLTKPCPSVALYVAVEAAVEQHRLITAERVLLEHTLHGSITALTDVLALTNPLSFGRAIRIKRLVAELTGVLDIPERWQVEVAAMLSQLACITLPAATQAKVYYGEPLSEDEEQMVRRLPAVTEQLLAHIPRLEIVRGILAAYTRSFPLSESVSKDALPDVVRRGAALLRVAVDFDVLEAEGYSCSRALDIMMGRADRYEAMVLKGLDTVRGGGSAREEVCELTLAALKVGMVFAEDVKLESGALLVTRGYEVTSHFLERIRNFHHHAFKDRLRVIVHRGTTK